MEYFQITYNIKDSEDRHHQQHFIQTQAKDLEDAKRWAESEREEYEEVYSVVPWRDAKNLGAEHEIW